MKHSIFVISVIMFFLTAATPFAHAQGVLASEEARRRLRDERLAIDEAAAAFFRLPEAPRDRFEFDYGGFIDFNYTNFRALGRRRQVGSQDLRFWMSGTLDNVQSLYARFQTKNIDWGKGDAFDGRRHHFIRPKVDVLFYNLDIAEALRVYQGIDMPMGLRLRVGRQFIYLGRGWLYFDRNEALLLEGELGPLEWRTFAAQSILHDDNFDVTAPRFDRSRRYFYGGQATWRDIADHRPYMLWLFQRDQSGKLFADPVFKHDYDSNYMGLGIEGSITPQLAYHVEGIRQWGHSTSADLVRRLSSKDRISAWAFDVGLDYYFDHPATPRVGVQYALASGDPDRGSVTNTIGGNRLGTTDKNFLSFGFMETGYSFAPRFSNLQFLKADASLRPFGESSQRIWREMSVGTAFYQFWKARSRGVVSDARVDRSASDLGQELDVYLDWQVLSDMRLTVQYGIFYPGRSLTEKRNTDFVSVGVLFSF